MVLKIGEMGPDEIMNAVREKYGRVAEDPGGKFNFPVGKKFALSVGYPEDELSRLPESICESFTGAGNPQPYVDPTPGAVLLDLGCGAGLDLYFYAGKTAGGKVYGLDFSEKMVEKARRNLSVAGAANFEFFRASADAIPMDDLSVDLVVSNGIYNLSPDKKAVAKEAFRVLKHGGKTVFSEVVLKAPLPERTLEGVDDWFRCIGGAMVEGDLVALLESAGFAEVKVLDRVRNARCGHELAVCATVSALKQAPGGR